MVVAAPMNPLELGRVSRVPARWQTPFGRWIADYTVPRLVSDLQGDPAISVTRWAVYAWLAGHPPRPARAEALVRLSNGRLTLEDIYRHADQVREIEAAGRAAG